MAHLMIQQIAGTEHCCRAAMSCHVLRAMYGLRSERSTGEAPCCMEEWPGTVPSKRLELDRILHCFSVVTAG